MNSLLAQVESAYGFEISACTPAPRGFVAQTYCLLTNEGKYFVKIVDNPRLAANMSYSLAVQREMAQRLDYIPAPIKTLSGEFVWASADHGFVSLYAYIEGRPNTMDDQGNPHGAEEDFAKLVPLMAEVYKLEIECEKAETFPVWLKPEFEVFLGGGMPLSKEVLAYINSCRPIIQDNWSAYKRVCEGLSGRSGGLYITHGDMPGNLVVDADDKLYIVDWDDILMGPVERDFWMYMDKPENIRKIAEILRGRGIAWTFRRDYYLYYLYTRFFDDLYGYLELDALRKEEPSLCIQRIQAEVLDWLGPLLQRA